MVTLTNGSILTNYLHVIENHPFSINILLDNNGIHGLLLGGVEAGHLHLPLPVVRDDLHPQDSTLLEAPAGQSLIPGGSLLPTNRPNL